MIDEAKLSLVEIVSRLQKVKEPRELCGLPEEVDSLSVFVVWENHRLSDV